jgi:D-proline reductase (dithiol) PrdB
MWFNSRSDREAAMGDHVRYIDRTRDYYLSQGYAKPYEWAHFDDVPFAALSRPLSECRAALVSTSDVGVRSPDGTGRDKRNELLVGNAYCIATDTPVERLFSRQEHYDIHATHLDDVNTYFPVTRLQEKVAEGRLGSLAPRCHGVYTAYSQRRTLEIDAPVVLDRCRQDEVDVAILTPI